MVAQGLTSFTIDANTLAAVDDDWIQKFLAVGTLETGALMLRAIVRANSGNALPISNYQSVFSRYAGQGIATHGILTSEFDHQGGTGSGFQVTDGLNGLNNNYINDFSFRAADFAGKLKDNGLKSYFIWNEPNDSNPKNGNYIPDARNFAALMYQSYHRIKAENTGGFVYMGGLLWPNGPVTPTEATDSLVGYLRTAYQYLQANSGGIPWDAVNVHVHHCNFQNSDMDYLRSQLDLLKGQFSDGTPIYVGEWGLQHFEGAQEGCMLNAFTWIRNHFQAMWYFQHPTRDIPGSCVDSDYGVSTWSQTNVFHIEGNCPLWDQLHYVLQYPNP